MMKTPQTSRQVLDLLLQDFSSNPEVHAKISGYISGLPVQAPDAYLVEYETLVNGHETPVRYVVLDRPMKNYRECTTELFKEAGVPSTSLTALIKAAREVMSWTEAAHRPPVRDELEHGRSAAVRLHALVDLREALLAFDDEPKHSLLAPLPEMPLEKIIPQNEPPISAVPEEGPGLYEMTYVFETMGYVGMERIRRTLTEMGGREGEKAGTVVINLEMPEFTTEKQVKDDKEGA